MIIKLRASSNTGNVPSVLSDGEVALNSADQILYYRHSNGSILQLSNGQVLGVDHYARLRANSAYDRANASLIVAGLSSNQNQIPSNTNPYIVTFNTQEILSEINYLTSNSQIQILIGGTYLIRAMAHTSRTAGGGTPFAVCWLRKNGVNIPSSAVRVDVESKDLYKQFVLCYALPFMENDILQLMFAVSQTFNNFGLITNTTIGGIVPSIRLTLTRMR